jgi:hypothetical protein
VAGDTTLDLVGLVARHYPGASSLRRKARW